MLFGEELNATANAIAPGVGWAAAVISSVFAWLTYRDKTRFDADKKILEFRVNDLTTKQAECEQGRQNDKSELRDLHNRMDRSDRDRAADVALIRELQRQLTEQTGRRHGSDPSYHGPMRRETDDSPDPSPEEK